MTKEEEEVVIVGFMREDKPERWVKFKFVCTRVCWCTRIERLFSELSPWCCSKTTTKNETFCHTKQHFGKIMAVGP